MSNGVAILITMGVTAIFLWAFRPITPLKIFGFVLFLAAIWFIRQVIDFGYNPLEGQVPDVEINRK
jgi:hypothetical protein